ncbi:MAG: S1 family peptidase [Deltaproteobacteria bacterium]
MIYDAARLACVGLLGLLGLAVGCGGADLEATHQSSVVGGQRTWAWDAVGRFTRPDHELGFCSGTLVGRRWVLSAAHCFAGRRVFDRRNFFVLSPRPGVEHRFAIERVIQHPSFSALNLDQGHDLALVELRRDVTQVNPMGLARSDAWRGRSVKLVGYGWHRQVGDFDRYRRVGDADINRIMSTHRVGLRRARGEASTGPGDSGGPMAWQEEINGTTRWRVAGVHSDGALPRDAIETLVAPYRAWILRRL